MNQEKNVKTPLEKITFLIGLLVITILIGYLVYQIIQDENLPPELKITTSYQSTLPNYTFKIMAENIGGESAEAINIKLNLYQNGELAQNGTVTIDYVPIKSKETAWIVFHKNRNPTDSLVVSSITYVKP